MNTKTLMLGVAICAAAIACAGKKPPPASTIAKSECGSGPDWTCMRSGPCAAPEMKDMLCAVGSSEGISSFTLARETAATRARTEMGAVIKSKVDGFTRAVQDSVSKSGAGEESVQKIGALSQNVVDETLHGVTVPKTYYNEQLKVHFAMAALDSKTFIEALKGLKQAGALSAAVKSEIDARAESVVNEWQSERKQ